MFIKYTPLGVIRFTNIIAQDLRARKSFIKGAFLGPIKLKIMVRGLVLVDYPNIYNGSNKILDIGRIVGQ